MGGSRRRGDELSDDTQALVVARRWLPCLLDAWLGGPNQIHVETISVRRRDNGVLVVVSGMELADMKAVVCFGSGDDVWDALRAVSKNIGRGRWSADKYRK